ncbi:helix-turn-helix domain-containing protein [uncultured Alistipes sp.]|uniref:helix-turn-helix domain-containing protein n=1 Tax=uncultured Alistipes sp. TaxID=538949 RepID=UPI00262E3758|nr:helix-turn-helix domain-containing protein [uncultured Alistipes sp.]
MEERTLQELFARIDRLARIADRVLQQRGQPTAERWLDGNMACRKLNISKRTLQYYRESGNIPFTRIEGKPLYREADIDDFLKARTVECEQI